MSIYTQSLLMAFGLSVIFMWTFLWLARKRHFFIQPIRDRDNHKTPTPRVGGLAIIATFFVMVVYWQIRDSSVFNFSNLFWHGININLLGLLMALLLLTFVNIIDDFKGLPWWIKLISQFAAAIIVFSFGIKIPSLTNPFGNMVALGGISAVFVVMWLVMLSNAINWLDGMDGLAGGVTSISLLILFLLSMSPAIEQKENAMLAIITLGAVIGFLPFNLPPASAFMGDTGAVFLGFLIGVVAIISGGKIATAFLVLAVPFLDAFAVIVQRLLNHQSPFKADRRHLFHHLQNMGWKTWWILILFYSASGIMGVLALYAQSKGKFYAGIIAIILIAMFTIVNMMYFSKKRALNADQ